MYRKAGGFALCVLTLLGRGDDAKTKLGKHSPVLFLVPVKPYVLTLSLGILLSLLHPASYLVRQMGLMSSPFDAQQYA